MVEAALFICPRVDDPHRRVIAGAKERPCSKCGQTIAVTPATLARSEASHPDTLFLCIECAVEWKGELTLHPPTLAQMQELEKAGHDRNDWPLREAWGEKVTPRK